MTMRTERVCSREHPRLVQGLIRSFVQSEVASGVRGFLGNVRREMETT